MKQHRARMMRMVGAAFLLSAVAGLMAEHLTPRQAPLFVIERSTNANVVHYDANIGPDGQLDPQRPVSAYWVMAAADGHREELTALERAKAYGFTVEPGPDAKSYHLRLVSQKQRDIAIVREGDIVRAESVIDGRRAWLQKMYVSTHRVLAVPTVKYIDLFGVDVASGQNLTERFVP